MTKVKAKRKPQSKATPKFQPIKITSASHREEAKELTAAISALAKKASQLHHRDRRVAFLKEVYRYVRDWKEMSVDDIVLRLAVEAGKPRLRSTATLPLALIRLARPDDDHGKLASRWGRACTEGLEQELDAEKFELRLYRHGVDGFVAPAG